MKIWKPTALLLLFFLGCQNDAKTNLKPLDLLQYGAAITIMAPDSAKVTTEDLLVQKDISIKKGDDYFVQVSISDVTSTDIPTVKAERLALVKSDKYFKKIIEDKPDGFIYETQIDSTYHNFGFQRVNIQGTKEYIFQTGFTGQYSLEDVKRMYEATKGKK